MAKLQHVRSDMDVHLAFKVLETRCNKRDWRHIPSLASGTLNLRPRRRVRALADDRALPEPRDHEGIGLVDKQEMLRPCR
jgi:hypothetical protein